MSELTRMRCFAVAASLWVGAGLAHWAYAPGWVTEVLMWGAIIALLAPYLRPPRLRR